MPRDTVGLEILHRHDHHIPVAIRDTAHMAPPTIITRLEKLRFHSIFRSEVSHDPIITPVAVGLDPNGVPPVQQPRTLLVCGTGFAATLQSVRPSR